MITGEISEEESLFAGNSNRKKRQDAPDPSIIPISFEELNFTDAQQVFCDNDPSCLYDLVITEDEEIAQTTLDEEKEINATIATLSKYLCM